MPTWPTDTVTDLATVRQQLSSERDMNELLTESIADLELAAEDRGWTRLSGELDREFTREGRTNIARICRMLAIANPLIKRGIGLRTAYVWGAGVQVQARAESVNEIVQVFLDANSAALTSGQAREELERALATDGNIFLALFTDTRSGAVRVRSIPTDEINAIVSNPEDRDEPWYYRREWTALVVEDGYVGERTRRETRRAYYPALGYNPTRKPKMIDGVPVYWDAPIKHGSVNRLDGWSWGIGDVYASHAWATAYKDFLTDWAKLVKALSRFAWRATGDTRSKAQAAAAKIRASMDGVGDTAVMGSGQSLEAIPKSGATIDSDSGRPLAAMVAAGLGVPVTMLVADPGVTGARATAETLDKPMILEFTGRRELWTGILTDILAYVVRVNLTAGKLRGTVSRDAYGRDTITLPGDDTATIDVVWPGLEDEDTATVVDAVVKADATGKMPPETTARLLLHALGVSDVDELIQAMTDDDGNWLDPFATAGQVAVNAMRDGNDPASAIR